MINHLNFYYRFLFSCSFYDETEPVNDWLLPDDDWLLI